MRDPNETRKIKIIVNGQEYARLEDVPERFRSLFKDSDGDGIPDVLSQAKGEKTRNVQRSIKIHLRPGESLGFDPTVPVPLPDGLRFEDNGLERRISWRWISLRAVGAFVFVAIWDGLMAFFFHVLSSAKHVPSPAYAVLALFAALGVAMAYSVIAYLLNRTSVRIGPAEVSVRHGPVPWLGSRDVSRADIDQISCEAYDRHDDEAGWDPQVTYEVKLLLKDGSTVSLVSGVPGPQEALFIEQELRKP